MTAITDLTVEELERLIEGIVRRSIEESLEDLEALASRHYLSSIAEAREDYRADRVTPLDDLEDDRG